MWCMDTCVDITQDLVRNSHLSLLSSSVKSESTFLVRLFFSSYTCLHWGSTDLRHCCSVGDVNLSVQTAEVRLRFVNLTKRPRTMDWVRHLYSQLFSSAHLTCPAAQSALCVQLLHTHPEVHKPSAPQPAI